MKDTRRLMALALAMVLALVLPAGGAALAEGDVPAEPEIVTELGEIDLSMEEASPEEVAPQAQAVPEAAPAEGTQAEGTPVEGVPAEEASAEAAPATEPAPVEDASGEAAPAAEPAPEGEPTAVAAPEEAPAQEAPAEEVPSQEAPTEVPAPTAVFPTALTLGVKEQFALNGAEVAGGQSVTYASSKPKAVSVDANGLVTANRKGTAVVTCMLGQSVIGTCTVTVLKAPKKLAFPQKSVVISKDQSLPCPVTLPKGSAGSVAYASDNPAVLAVDGAGNLYGVSGGSATLTATAYNGRSASCAVRVLGGPAPTWVALNETALFLPVKGTAQLAAAFDEGRDALLTFATSNKKVVAVDENGLVTAKKAGQATVTVTTHNGLTAACEVQVFTAPKKVTLNTKKLTLNPGDAFQLIATLTKNSVSDIAWSSDNPGVASVDGNGLVTAGAVGKANVTVATTNGKRATCKVTVQDASGGAGGKGTLLFQEDTETLKLRVVDDHGVILAYMWLADPNRQLVKHYGNAKPISILDDAVAQYGLSDKLVVGFNACPPVTARFSAEWFKKSKYAYREPSPLMITNGQVLVNDPDDVNAGKFLYWIDSDGWLNTTDKALDEYTPQERAALYQQIIDSGTRNTIIWKPVLIRDYHAVPFTEKFLKRSAGKQRKHALCQIDEHNYIVVTSTKKGEMDYPHFQQFLMGLGVRTAVEFDAGASSAFMVKARVDNRFHIYTNGRPNTSMMFFTE